MAAAVWTTREPGHRATMADMEEDRGTANGGGADDRAGQLWVRGARDEGREREALRGYFEVFKHLSTVSTAVLVVVLVLYRDLYVDPALALLSLAAFGVCVLASFCGMYVAAIRRLPEKSGFPGALLRGILFVAAGGLGAAVLCLAAGIAAATNAF